MNKKIKLLFVTLASILGFSIPGQNCFAQDTGKPALRSVALYTVGGGVLGSGIGVAYWLLDPLAPNADLRGGVMQGFGAGVFLGMIFGFVQLNKQAVVPYKDSTPTNEFQGSLQNVPNEGNSFHIAERREKSSSPRISIINYQFRF